jgi:hypothetical protein
MRASSVACGILLLGLPSMFLGQAAQPDDRQQSCGAFVQNFYAWYVKKDAESSRKHLRTSDIALKDRPEAFDVELSHRLKEDSEAQAKVKDDIVGLDFDPVLGGQDSCPRYETRKITMAGDSCRVEVFGNCGGKHAKPDVVPELANRSGQWVFVNFRYPQSGETDDLLTILRKLRDDRKKQSAAPPR